MYIIWTSYMHIICTPYALCTFQSFHRSPLTRRLPVVSPRRSLDFLREMRRTQIRPNHNTRRLVKNFRRGLGCQPLILARKGWRRKMCRTMWFSWDFTRGFGWDLAMMIRKIYENDGLTCQRWAVLRK